MPKTILRGALLLAVSFAFLSVGATQPAFATKTCPNSGYCKPGTCALDGSARACNIKYCSKKNCRS